MLQKELLSAIQRVGNCAQGQQSARHYKAKKKFFV